MKLFVYGTLRKNHHNNILLFTSSFLGEAITEVGYELALSGIPYLIKGGEQVVGEVYEVDEETLSVIDQLEGHPDCYTRKDIKVFLNDELITVQAYHWCHIDKTDIRVYPRTTDYSRSVGRC